MAFTQTYWRRLTGTTMKFTVTPFGVICECVRDGVTQTQEMSARDRDRIIDMMNGDWELK